MEVSFATSSPGAQAPNAQASLEAVVSGSRSVVVAGRIFDDGIADASVAKIRMFSCLCASSIHQTFKCVLGFGADGEC